MSLCGGVDHPPGRASLVLSAVPQVISGTASLGRLETILDEGEVHLGLIEFDRTRRVHKNFEKFRRYDTFVNWWWRRSPLGDLEDPPIVVFSVGTRSTAGSS